jgi:hypothetical protein
MAIVDFDEALKLVRLDLHHLDVLTDRSSRKFLCEFAPARARIALLPLIQLCEELFISQRLAMLLSVLEDLVGEINPGSGASG